VSQLLKKNLGPEDRPAVKASRETLSAESERNEIKLPLIPSLLDLTMTQGASQLQGEEVTQILFCGISFLSSMAFKIFPTIKFKLKLMQRQIFDIIQLIIDSESQLRRRQRQIFDRTLPALAEKD